MVDLDHRRNRGGKDSSEFPHLAQYTFPLPSDSRFDKSRFPRISDVNLIQMDYFFHVHHR